MQITRREEYGLKGLIFLARQPGEKVSLVSEISRVQKIPEKFPCQDLPTPFEGGTSSVLPWIKGRVFLRETGERNYHERGY